MQIFHTIILPPHWSCPLYFPRIAHAQKYDLKNNTNISYNKDSRAFLPSLHSGNCPHFHHGDWSTSTSYYWTTNQEILASSFLDLVILFHYGAACTDTACLVWGLLLRCGGWPTLGWVAICQGFIRHLHNSTTPGWPSCLGLGWFHRVCLHFILVDIGCFLSPKNTPKKSLTLKMCLLFPSLWPDVVYSKWQ